MAVKTITIDLEAYDALSRHKKPGQSFSQVIKQHFEKRHTVEAFLRGCESVRLSDPALDSIDQQVRNRRREKARPIKL